MDCKEFEKWISDFIADRLDYRQLKKFMEHADSCEACREELTIQFLVTEGMARLESGGAFDLQREMDLRVEQARHSMRIHNVVIGICIALGLCAIGALGVILWLLL